jgi:hypothetical protein
MVACPRIHHNLRHPRPRGGGFRLCASHRQRATRRHMQDAGKVARHLDPKSTLLRDQADLRHEAANQFAGIGHIVGSQRLRELGDPPAVKLSQVRMKAWGRGLRDTQKAARSARSDTLTSLRRSPGKIRIASISVRGLRWRPSPARDPPNLPPVPQCGGDTGLGDLDAASGSARASPIDNLGRHLSVADKSRAIRSSRIVGTLVGFVHSHSTVTLFARLRG